MTHYLFPDSQNAYFDNLAYQCQNIAHVNYNTYRTRPAITWWFELPCIPSPHTADLMCVCKPFP